MRPSPTTTGASRPRSQRNSSWYCSKKVLGWPKRCKLAHASLWEYSYKRLKLAQLLGQLGVSLTCSTSCRISGAPPSQICAANSTSSAGASWQLSAWGDNSLSGHNSDEALDEVLNDLG